MSIPPTTHPPTPPKKTNQGISDVLIIYSEEHQAELIPGH